MNCKIFLSFVAMLALNGVLASNPPNEERKNTIHNKICRSFKSMYIHLAYLSHYMSRRANEITNDRASLSKQNDKIKKSSRDICTLLAFDDSADIPYWTSSIDILNRYYKGGDSALSNLDKVETDIKSALDIIRDMVDIWSKTFTEIVGFFSVSFNTEKNTNVFKLLYSDFVVIFFPIIKEVYEVYEVNPNKTKPYEIYAKDIYVDGQKAYRDLELYSSDNGLALIHMTKKAYRGDTDLMERMCVDMESQIKDMPPQLKTLIKVFRYYKAALDKLA